MEKLTCSRHRIAYALIALLFLQASCNSQVEKEEGEGKTTLYTCPMHPQVVKHQPSTCPVCGMDLVLFDKGNEEKSLTLSKNQQLLANITTVNVGNDSMTGTQRLMGRLVSNPESTQYISSRTQGRMERLYIKETGMPVHQGQPLYQIYSEELLTFQHELLMTHEQAKALNNDRQFQEIHEAARQKLLLYGQSAKQIDQVLADGKVNPYSTFYSPKSGIVSKIEVLEGQYVEEGTALMELENYGTLWVEADVYASEARQIGLGQTLTVALPGTDEQKSTKIEFINPILTESGQTTRIRGSLANRDHGWQAGMMVNVLLPRNGKLGTRITLPLEAVINDGTKSIVWMALEEGKFEPRNVETGLENAHLVEITSGLSLGERVVATGAYLLYSEYLLKKGTTL